MVQKSDVVVIDGSIIKNKMCNVGLFIAKK